MDKETKVALVRMIMIVMLAASITTILAVTFATAVCEKSTIKDIK